ncbi:MAG: hypothetical protein JXR23_01465 [Pontiellaceae bacterium]|nr:hypothetical protein [Pontiellaceae bacterium]
MNRYLLLSVCLFIFDLSSHAEFRVWRNTDGKLVTAEYVGMKDEKVILLREDGIEFLLSPDMLCEEDQAYIKDKLSAPAQDSSDGTDEKDVSQHISESEAKLIAEKYAEALKDNNLEALKKLIWKSEDPERAWDSMNSFDGAFSAPFWDEEMVQFEKLQVKNVRVKSVKKKKYGYEVRIQIVRKERGNTIESDGYIQMLRSGKVKYDTIGLLHPYEIICREIESGTFVLKNYIRDRKEKVSGFEVTLFGCDEAESSTDRTLTRKKMIKWLRDEGEEWDETEPRVPCQKDVFKYWVETLRSVENR